MPNNDLATFLTATGQTVVNGAVLATNTSDWFDTNQNTVQEQVRESSCWTH